MPAVIWPSTQWVVSWLLKCPKHSLESTGWGSESYKNHDHNPERDHSDHSNIDEISNWRQSSNAIIICASVMSALSSSYFSACMSTFHIHIHLGSLPFGDDYLCTSNRRIRLSKSCLRVYFYAHDDAWRPPNWVGCKEVVLAKHPINLLTVKRSDNVLDVYPYDAAQLDTSRPFLKLELSAKSLSAKSVTLVDPSMPHPSSNSESNMFLQDSRSTDWAMDEGWTWLHNPLKYAIWYICI